MNTLTQNLHNGQCKHRLLADYGKQLKQGVKYKWFVALIPDEQHRAKDVLAAGSIERVAFQDDLKRKLNLADDNGRKKLKHEVFFVGTDMREPITQGLADYIPISITRVPLLQKGEGVTVPRSENLYYVFPTTNQQLFPVKMSAKVPYCS